MMYFRIYLALIIIISYQKAKSQTTGYWLFKKSIPEYTNTDFGRNPILTELSFTINDTVYVGSLKALYQYNKETNTLIKRSPLNGITNIITSFSVSNKAYVLARLIGGGARIYEYDPKKDLWTPKQMFYGTNANGAANFVINGKAYIIGGQIAAINPEYISKYYCSSQVWEYNPLSNAFVKKENLPFQEGYRLNSITFDNVPNVPTAFTIGKLGYALLNEDEFYQYDPIVNTWYKKTSPYSITGSIITNCRSTTTSGNFKAFSFNEIGYSIYTITEFYGSVCNSRLRSKVLKYLDQIDSWQLLNSGCTSEATCPVSTGANYFGSNTSNSKYTYFTTPSGDIVEWTPIDNVVESTRLFSQTNSCINYGNDANLQIQFTTFGNFNTDNKFKLLLSDENGDFAIPTILDEIQTSTTFKYDGEFNFYIQKNYLDTNKRYKLKIISTSPAVDDQRNFLIKDSLKFNSSHSLLLEKNIICENSFSKITADTNASNFAWYKNNVLQNGVVNKSYLATQAGSYYCQVTMSNGCISNTDTVQLSIAKNPAAPDISSLSYCQGSNSNPLTALPSIGNTLKWYALDPIGGSATDTAPIPSTLIVGIKNYYVSQRNNISGCESPRSQIAVTINTIPDTPIISNKIFCQSTASNPLTAVALNGHILLWWGNYAIGGLSSTTAPIISTINIGTNNYYVSQKNSITNCESPRSKIIVTVNSLTLTPTISVYGNQNICNGGSVTLTSSSSVGNQWYKDSIKINGENNRTYTAATSGKYSVVSTIGGCSSNPSNNIEVVVGGSIATPTINANGILNICSGGSVTLTSSSSLGNQWYKDGIKINGENNTTYTATTSGKYTVVSTIGGCISNPSNNIEVVVGGSISNPTIKAIGIPNICSGGSVTLTSSSSVGNQWYKDGIKINGENNTTYTATTSGKYAVISTVGGCSSNPSNIIEVVLVSNISTPTISVNGITDICSGGSVILTSSSSVGNQWYKNGMIINGENNTTYIATTAGKYTVVSSVGGCSSSTSQFIEITVSNMPATPVIKSNGSATICFGSSVILTSSFSVGNQWYKDGTAISGATNNTYSASSEGTYTCIVKNNCGQSSSNLVNVINNPLPPKPAILWNSTEFSTDALGAFSYQWMLNNIVLSGATSKIYKPSSVGNYKVQIIDINGCKNLSDSFHLVVTAVDNLNFTPIDHIAKIFPNPASNILLVRLNQKPKENLEIQIFENTGRLIYANASQEKTIQININKYKAGNYILKISGKLYNQAHPIIIIK